MNDRNRSLIVAGAGIALIIGALSLYGVLLGNRPDVQREGGTPGLVRGTVVVNFEGVQPPRARVSRAFTAQPGKTAWDAIQNALGSQRVKTQDFGGDLGVMITAFDDVDAKGNQFWEFLVNGKTADVGISGYKVQDGDVLEFRLSSF